MVIHILVLCTWNMNDQSPCIIIFLYKINIAPWLMGTASTMLALRHWHLPRFIYDAYQVLSCMKMLNTMAVIQQLN